MIITVLPKYVVSPDLDYNESLTPYERTGTAPGEPKWVSRTLLADTETIGHVDVPDGQLRF